MSESPRQGDREGRMSEDRIGKNLEEFAVGRIEEEARRVIARLQDGSGRVEKCHAHSDLAEGVRLSLEMLLVIMQASVCRPRMVMTATAIGAGIGAIIAGLVAALKAIAISGGGP